MAEQKDNDVVLTLKRKPNWLILPLTGFWLLGWAGMMATVTYGLVTDTDKLDGEIIFIMTFFFLAGVFVLKIFLWHLRGQEKITLDANELKIEKLGTILTTQRKFEIQEIDGFSIAENSTTPKWIRFWGFGGGQIQSLRN